MAVSVKDGVCSYLLTCHQFTKGIKKRGQSSSALGEARQTFPQVPLEDLHPVALQNASYSLFSSERNTSNVS